MTNLKKLPELNTLLEWYEQNKLSLNLYKNHLERLNQSNRDEVPVQFKGLSKDEFDEYFQTLQSEVSLLFVFYIISLSEGKVRLNFFDRIKTKNTDSISKKYIRIYNKSPQKAKEIRLEDILDIWKEHFKNNGLSAYIPIVGEFKSRMKTRHWIAHGRYWDFNAHNSYTVNNTFDKCDNLLKLTPFTY